MALSEARIRAAGRILAAARRERDALPPREAAEAAYTPGGMSVDDIEALIIRHRAEARAALRATAA